MPSIIDILKIYSTTLLSNRIYVQVDVLNLLGKNKLSSRLTQQLLLVQEFNAHLTYIDGTSNVFVDTLLCIPYFNNLEACNCENEIPCKYFYHTIN